MSNTLAGIEALQTFGEYWLLLSGVCVVLITIGLVLLWLFPPKDNICEGGRR